MNPQYVVVTGVERVDDRWVVQFRYLFRKYVAELSTDGRLLSLRER